ncbi:MAG: Lrp/AsnC ligand binding domain-containing protein [Bacteroidales bacterium]|nr:Lrp/AsnC ligand binding domain-containing protein [Bacteroidales bacterium]
MVCHYTTGNYSLFLKAYTRDNEHLRESLTKKIQAITGVTKDRDTRSPFRSR